MVTVVSPELLAAHAAWDDGPAVGAWIAVHLGPFGASVGHAVPLGYPAYAIVPIPYIEDGDDLAPLRALLELLGPFTGEQPVHSGVWEGYGWFYDGFARGMPAGMEVERPDAEPLALPNRSYHLWTGPLRSALALGYPPSLIWPEDRSWFAGAPIYTNEVALGGPERVIEAVLADARTAARRATTDDDLDIDD